MYSEIKEINCPVCGDKMHNAGNLDTVSNSNFYFCAEKRKIYLPYFRESIGYYDCALEIHNDGQYTFQNYMFPPYKIIIRNSKIYSNEYGTSVSMIKDIKYDDHVESSEPFITWKEVFQTDSLLELPLKDFDKCIEKLKLLSTFS
jgi:hypothetical protein